MKSELEEKQSQVAFRNTALQLQRDDLDSKYKHQLDKHVRSRGDDFDKLQAKYNAIQEELGLQTRKNRANESRLSNRLENVSAENVNLKLQISKLVDHNRELSGKVNLLEQKIKLLEDECKEARDRTSAVSRECKELGDSKRTSCEADAKKDRNLAEHRNCLGDLVGMARKLQERLEFVEQINQRLKEKLKRMEVGLIELISQVRSSIQEWNREAQFFRLFYADKSWTSDATGACVLLVWKCKMLLWKLREVLTCPISGDLIEVACGTTEGHVYNERHMKAWLKIKWEEPKTRTPNFSIFKDFAYMQILDAYNKALDDPIWQYVTSQKNKVRASSKLEDHMEAFRLLMNP